MLPLMVCLLLLPAWLMAQEPTQQDVLTYGPGKEPAVTSGQTWMDSTLGSNCTSGNYNKTARNCSGSDGDAYNSFSTFLSNCGCGEVCLLRAGTYILPSSPYAWPNCTATTLRQVFAYNQENAIVLGSTRFNNYTFYAGFTTNGSGSGNGSVWIFDQGTIGSGVRNMRCATDSREASLCANMNVPTSNWHISGSYITQQNGNHASTVKAQGLCGGYFGYNKLEDLSTSGTTNQDNMVIEQDWDGCLSNPTIIEHNYWKKNRRENHLDMKVARAGAQGHVILRHNYFSPDAADACLIAWGQRTGTDIFYEILHNYFDRCDSRAINFSAGHSASNPAGFPKANNHLIRHNVFRCTTPDSGTQFDIKVNDLKVEHNTFYHCGIDFAGGDSNPTGLTLRSNLFKDSQFAGDTGGTIVCSQNNLFSSQSLPFACTGNTSVDAQFVSGTNFNIQNAALFFAGHDTLDVGAMHRPIIAANGCEVGKVSPTTMTIATSTPFGPVAVLNQAAFAVKKGGTPQTIGSTSVQGQTEIRLHDLPAFQSGDTATLGMPTRGAFRNSQWVGGQEGGLNGESAVMSDMACTGGVSSAAPTIQRCVVGAANKKEMTVTYDTNNAPPIKPANNCAGGVTLKDDGVANPIIVGGCVRPASNNEQHVFTATNDFTPGSITFSFAPASGNIRNAAETPLAAATDFPCENNTAVAPPTLIEMHARNTARRVVEISVDAGGLPPMQPSLGVTGFSFTQNAVPLTVTGCTSTASSAFCTLAADLQPASAGPLLGTYTPASGNFLNNAGTELTAFTNVAVVNEVQADAGVLVVPESHVERVDDYDESTPAPLCAPNTVCDRVSDRMRIRVRWQVRCEGSCFSANLRPTVSLNGAAAEYVQNTFVQKVRFANDQRLTNLMETTNQLTPCCPSFTPGVVWLNPFAAFPALTLGCSEVAANLELQDTFGPGDTLRLEVQTDTSLSVRNDAPVIIPWQPGRGIR